MATVNLVSPWVNYYREVEALFRNDPEVRVIYFEDNNKLRLYVDSGKKAEAISRLIPVERKFGNVTLLIEVIPGNKEKLTSEAENLFKAAFDGNKALSFIQTISGIFTNELTYVVFIPEVVQYYTDDLGDIHGIRSTLYQDIAKEVFADCGIENVYFCTDITAEVGVYKIPINR